MNRNLGLLVLFLCLRATLLTGQTPFFQQYHPVKKSQPMQVNALFQDRKGFVWFGTDKGLFRFDGLHYRHYTAKDSLPDDHVTALAEDTVGRLWIGHTSGLISSMDRETITTFETREGAAVESISDILFDRKGTMWFGTRGDGLYYYRNERLHRIDEEEGLPDLFIYDLFEDPSGKVWAATDGGIAVCSFVNGQVQIDVINTDDGLPDIIIKKIKPIHGDTLALATEDVGILTYNLTTKRIAPLSTTPWEYGTITDFVVKENQFWIATPRSGLIVYDNQNSRIKVLRDFNGLSLLSVNTVLNDREGNIWSGSKTGLSRTLGDALEHIDLDESAGDDNVLAIALDNGNNIWFSTSEGLFVRSPGTNGKSIIRKKLQNTSFRNSPIISLYADDRGFIWAGLYGDGLIRIDPDNNAIKHFDKELRNGNILSITGKGDRVWVGTLGGASSIRITNNNYVVENFSSADGLSSDFIYQVFIDTRDRTWFTTDGKGVTMLDKDGFHHYQDGLPSGVVYSLTEDAGGNIWISSQDNGIYRFEGSKFVSEPELRLRDNSVQSLVADNHGNLVAIHNFGLDVFNTSMKKMRYWGEENGIRDKQPNLNAVTRDQYGQFYIGTTRGIMKFSLNNDLVVSVPEPVIDGVSIFDEDIDISRSPRLKYNENNVTIHYLGLWYQNTATLNYLYKLENYDLEWITTRNQEVTYSRLPAGDYTFRVKVSDTEDFTHARETSISFSIRPPFWRTGTFYVFIIGFFFIGAYALMKFREGKLLEDKLILEARVDERTREIQQKTEEIQAQNEEIMAQAEEIQGINENLEMLVKQRTAELEKKNKALEEYAFINAHKLRSPVASILGLVNLLAKSDQKDDTKVIREHLAQSADKLDEVVRSITKAIEKADNKYL